MYLIRLLVNIHLLAYRKLTSFKSIFKAKVESQVETRYVSLIGFNPIRFSFGTIGSKGLDNLSCKGNPAILVVFGPGDTPKQ